MQFTRNHLWLLIALGALAAYPLTRPPTFVIFLLVLIVLYAVFASYFNFLIGYGGILFITPMTLYALGGFIAAFFSRRILVDPLLAILIGGVVGLIGSFAFSLLSTRLRGLYMALFSVVITLVIRSIFIRHDILPIQYVTGGSRGHLDIPDIVVAGYAFRSGGGVAYLYLGIIVLVVSLFVLRRLLRSNFGLALRSVRDAETYASTLGVNVFRTKILAFMVAGFFLGIVGGILSHYLAAIGPDDRFNVYWVFFFLTVVLFGGIGTFLGPIVGVAILVPLDFYLTIYGPWRLIIVGIIIVLTMLIAPAGIIGRLQSLVRGRAPGLEGRGLAHAGHADTRRLLHPLLRLFRQVARLRNGPGT